MLGICDFAVSVAFRWVVICGTLRFLLFYGLRGLAIFVVLGFLVVVGGFLFLGGCGLLWVFSFWLWWVACGFRVTLLFVLLAGLLIVRFLFDCVYLRVWFSGFW